MKIQIGNNTYIEHERWTEEIQENFDVMIVSAAILNYEIKTYRVLQKEYDINLVGKREIEITFRFTNDLIIERLVVSTKGRRNCAFSTYQFQEAINYINSLL
ncbi:hypothetical protein D3C76_226000 [compost metagenome]